MYQPKHHSDPYQWFFPIGILFGIIGTGLWIVFHLHLINFYPGLVHTEIMSIGFVMTMALGFLMTAIPRFTGTHLATFIEKMILLVIVLSILLSSLLINHILFHFFSALEICFLIYFVGTRLLKCKFSPPPSFILIAFGLVGSLLAHVYLLISSHYQFDPFLLALARLFLNYGLVLCLVLGVGTQLIPALLGLKKTGLSNIQEGQKNKFDGEKIVVFSLLGVILLISFFMEAAGFLQQGRCLRASLILVLVLNQWHIYHIPKITGIFSWCLWISAWMFVIGPWPGVFWPHYAIHGAHILFIGSVSLMIFTVATRVTLSHGNHNSTPEKRSASLTVMLIVFCLSLLARLSVPLTNHYFEHLAYAGALWILAALIWCAGFLRKIFYRNKTGTNNC